MKILNNLAEAKTLVGEELGLSEWQKITQKHILPSALVKGYYTKGCLYQDLLVDMLTNKQSPPIFLKLIV